MSFLDSVIAVFPEVRAPAQKHLPFKEKLKWSLIVLVLFFVMGHIPLYGLGENALQKFLGLFFVIFEAGVYVFMGGLAPNPVLAGTPAFFEFQLILIFQLFLGGVLIMFMDEVISKWGFGSGISLFIAAGVAQEIFIRAFNFLPSPTNPDIAAGAIPALF